MVQPHELHKADLADAVLNYFLQFLIGRGGGHPGNKLSHIGSANLRLHECYNGVKRLLRSDAPSLHIDLSIFHMITAFEWHPAEISVHLRSRTFCGSESRVFAFCT